MGIMGMPVISSNGVLVNHYIYFSSDSFNSLMRFNFLNEKVEFVSLFPNEPILSQYSHRCAKKVEKSLLFSPWNALNLQIFDLDNCVFDTIKIPHKYNESIAEIICFGGKIYLFPVYTHDNLIEIDLKTRNIKIIKEFEDEKKRLGIFELKGTGKYILIDDCVWFSYWRDSSLMCWNMKTMKMKRVDTSAISIYNIYFSCGSIWITQYGTSDVIEWKSECDEKCYHIDSEINSKSELNWAYDNVVEFNNKTYLFPGHTNNVICACYGNCEKVLEIEDKVFKRKTDRQLLFPASIEYEENLWLMPSGIDQFWCMDKNHKVVKKISAVVKDVDGYDCKDIMSDRDVYLTENEVLDLDGFVKFLS